MLKLLCEMAKCTEEDVDKVETWGVACVAVGTVQGNNLVKEELWAKKGE
jgi:hypothetical protein